MGKTYKELKKKIGQLRFENSFLTFKVEKVLLENGRVKRELQVSNARIVELAQEIELLRNGLPFADEAKEALKDADFFTEKVGKPILEKMVEGDVAFSSRFMPNVKFKISGHRQELHDAKLPMMMFADFGKVENDGSFTGSASAPELFESWREKEVSIYEAIPELVPDGMVYDKESDSLCYISKKYIRNAMVFEDEEFVNELYKEIHKQSEM